MKLRSLLPVLGFLAFAPGCVIVQLGATNPIPGLTTVAVAPYINLSAERAVDGRRFALSYASELQKVPGFEVIPVGVTEIAMTEAKIDLNDPEEVLKLAKILRVDAVVVGAVTEYSPYYPPRIGLQVSWYSPRSWCFYPGIQTEPASRGQQHDWDSQRRQQTRDYQKQLDDSAAPETPFWQRMYRCFKRCPGVRTLYGEPTLVRNDGRADVTFRGQSPPAFDVHTAYYQELPGMPSNIRLVVRRDDQEPIPPDDQSKLPIEAPPAPGPANSYPLDAREDQPPPVAPPASRPPAPLPNTQPGPTSPIPEPGNPAPSPERSPFESTEPNFDPSQMPPSRLPPPPPPLPPVVDNRPPVRDPALAPPAPQPNPFNVPQPVQSWQTDLHQPLMAYTRIFDGSDADLCAALRDYVELNGDLRSGGWEAYLHRSDDFIRFTSYRMILEMLSLHGGEGKHRIVFKFRKYR